jgi:hypothetical protein
LKRLFLSFLLGAGYLAAIQHSGSVRAADQFIPGATVTARQGGAKLVTSTDEAGRYTLDLTPGVWEIQVEIFGFKPASLKIEIGAEPSSNDWTLEMPRPGDPVAAPPAAPAPPQRPGFQNLSVQATEAGAQTLAATAAEPPPPEIGGGDNDSFVVSGSTSGGLAAAADEQTRRDRQPGRSGAGGQAAGGIAEMAAMSAGGGLAGDGLGLNGFGAAGVQSGFGDGLGGANGGGARGFGAAAGGGQGGGGGRGGAGGDKQTKQTKQANKRGAAASFATIGNMRRNRPTYTGSLALTARNSVLDAKPFSLNGQNAPKGYYAQNTLAVNLGGPIRIPKIYSNDRLVFSFSYQGSRARNPFNSLSTMPSAEERAGDFSQAAVSKGPVTIYDPLTAAPFPGNIIPLNRFNPASAGLLKFFPLPTYPQLAVQNFQTVTSSRGNSDTYSFRQNLPLSRKDRVNVSFNYQTRTGTTPTLLGFRDAADGSGFNTSLGYSHSFAPRFNSNFTWNFSRSTGYNVPYFAYSENIAALLGINGTTQEPIAYGPPNVSFTNFGGLSDGSASISRNQTSDLNEAVTLVRKKHNLTFGLGYRRLQQNPMNYANARGSFSFSGLLTSGLDSNGNPLAHTGLDFADFLLGFPQSSSLQFGAKSNYFRSWSINGFAQDDFRFKPNLSINLGLRYEYFSPYTELFGRMANLDLNSTITAAAVITPGQSGPYSGALPTSLVRSDSNNYSPRFGFAWKPNPKKPLTIRGGYSIFFNGSAYGTFASKMASQPPFVRSASLSTSTANRLTLQNGFAAAPSQTITNNYAIDPNYRLGYAQTWTFALQRNLPRNSIIELEYIGTKGTALDILRQPNRATPGSPLTAAQRLQIGNATGFTLETSQGSSIMHMGQVRLTRRLVRGVSAVATYGFQKSLDNASSFGGGGGAVAQNDQDLRLERGLSTFDQRHHLNVQYVLTSPVGGARGLLRGQGFSRKLLEGWTLTGGFNATSGTPLTARVSGNLANTGGTAAFGSGRAQATGLPIQGGTYFNLLAFTTPPAGLYGDAGRNTIPGLFRTSLNASFGRAFRLAESRRQLAVRINTTNAFNHVVVTNVGTTVNSATYGLPTAASPTRSVNLTLRLTF